MPAGGKIRPVPRAASGITQSGITTGLGGASLDWDRRARVTPVEEREVFRPRLGEPYRTGRPAKYQEAWPEAEPLGRESLWRVRGGTPTGERALQGARRAMSAEVTEQRLAGVLPSFFLFVNL